jgi:AcrR family transcriptional regulator
MEPQAIVSKGELTRGDIVEAAYRLFLEQGYHGTSMRQIAQAAGIALGGIYNHFGSKEEIFLSVLRDHHPYYEVLPAMNAAQGDTVEDYVRDAANRMVGTLEKRQDFLNVMFIELVEFKGQHIPYLFDIVYPQLMEFGGRFLRDQDRLRPIPLPILVRAFIGLFISYVITDLLIGQKMPPEMQEGALDHFVDIYLQGILEKPVSLNTTVAKASREQLG